jgi:RimJ/RimL family protein N-acetyltransferase
MHSLNAFQTVTVKLPLKGELQLREATVADASAVLLHLHEVLSQGPVDIPKLASEIIITPEQEAEVLRAFAEDSHSLFLVLEHEGKVVGNLDLKAYKRPALRHGAVLGMALQQAFRGQGLGKVLMTNALVWARSTGLKRIELFVYARNQPALALYKACGFVIEGCRKGFIYADGDYLDDYIMALYL